MLVEGTAFLLTFFLTFPYLPFVFRALNRDAGIFLYMASEILRGNLPYKDFWDHKGPLVYYLNALGLNFFGLWGVWFFHFLVFFVSGVFLIKILERKVKSKFVLVLSLLAFYLQLNVLFFEFDQVEIFAIVFQAAYIYFFLGKKGHSWQFLLGMLAGFSSLLRFNLIGFFLAGVLFLLFFQKKRNYSFVILQALGFFFVWLIAISFFWLKGGVFEFLDAAFFYNFLYLKTPLSSRFSALLAAFDYLNQGKTAIFFLAAFLTLLYKLNFSKTDFFLLFTFTFELVLTLASGRSFSHYYYLLVFPASYFVGRFFGEIEKTVGFKKHIWLYFLLISYFLLPFFKLSVSKFVGNYKASKESDLVRVVKFLRDKPYLKKVLVWGADPSVLFLSGKSSASKYYYQYPLFTPGYSEKAYRKFWEEVEKAKPKYIIDITAYTNKIIPLNEKSRKFWRINPYYSLPKGIDKFLNFVKKNYRLEKVFGQIEIYTLR